ncbi:VOC family protein [Aliiglaciecola sp. CAU 1673]|uniref:VOC family protein n=1 Tax=Aliiglaciecola sp. CAU 1673 TaxID=3032595 RepID=UPI0023DBCBE4|nr:VOC family protein [Aliiglaciecola sp. CAU 1673]MDF2179504.1 VOC family protein [Aliiglaciecola sp. CAU 1673]
MLKVVGIDHIVLRTDKLPDMLAFYCDVLGCKVERHTSVDIGLVQLRAGNALIDLVTLDGELGRAGGKAPTAEGNNLDHFCLQLESIEEQRLIGYLQAKGVETGDFAERYGAQGYGQSIYIKDPQGNTVELRSV